MFARVNPRLLKPALRRTISATTRQVLVGLVGLFMICGAHPLRAADEAAPSGEVKPRIAALYNVKKRHNGEFDYALTELDWSADRYYANEEDMAALPGKLSEYDIVIVAPLFNLEENVPMPGSDRAAYMKFIEDGGMLIVTDGSYTGIRKWLTDIDPRFGGLESGKCNSSQWSINGYVTDTDPPHPLRTFPYQILEPNSWPHFLEPSKETQWQLVSRCSEGFPVTFAQKIGKGMVSISSLRQASPKQFSNFFATLQVTRAELALQSFQMPDPAFGDGVMRLTFAGEPPTQATSLVYEIIPEEGAPQRFEKAVTGTSFVLPYRITLRGPVTARLLIKQNGKETMLFEQQAVMPSLLTVSPPAYRGMVSEARRFPTVRFGIQVVPDKENLTGAKVQFTVFDPEGKEISTTDLALDDQEGKLSWRQPIELDQKLPAGDYTVKATLADRSGKELADADASFKILAPRAAQTVIDEDGTFLVNGKPFFPMGIYHVKPEDYKEVADLGLNTVQFWAWHVGLTPYGVSRGLAAASANGLKVLYEANHKSRKIMLDTAARHADNPAILMWYVADEPMEADYGRAFMVRDSYHEGDLHHPTYVASVVPDLFAEQSKLADVFATDPYGRPAKAADWIPRAVQALEGQKPLVVVPGSFGKEETRDEMRAIAYIALTNDARGIIWYPWSQAGGGPLGIGAKTSPEQQATIARLCEEVKQLLPALTGTVRKPFQSEDGKLMGIYLQGKRKAVLLVNTTPEKIVVDGQLPEGLEKTNRKMKDFFKEHEHVLEVKGGKFQIELEPYETRAYAF